MKRRSFIGIIAGAIAATVLPKAPEPEPSNLIANGDMVHDLNSYNIADATAIHEIEIGPEIKAAFAPEDVGQPITFWGDGSGRVWILDPECPRDQIYGCDSRMYHEFARFQFRQREMWPRNSRITNLASRSIDEQL